MKGKKDKMMSTLIVAKTVPDKMKKPKAKAKKKTKK